MVLRFAVSAVDSELVLDVMLPAHLEGLTDMHAFMRILHEEPPSKGKCPFSNLGPLFYVPGPVSLWTPALGACSRHKMTAEPSSLHFSVVCREERSAPVAHLFYFRFYG